VSKDRKLRTTPGLPVPQSIISEDGAVELINMRLEDPNYIALRDYLNSKRVHHLHLQDNKNSDFQIKTILEGIANNNF